MPVHVSDAGGWLMHLYRAPPLFKLTSWRGAVVGRWREGVGGGFDGCGSES
jgi:hypothetical protein